LTILVMVGVRTEAHIFRSQVGIGSESDCLLGQLKRILDISDVVSYRRHNHPRQILSPLVKGLGGYGSPKSGIWFECRSYNSVTHYRATLWLYHRLRGSASPVLMATHHSYGSPRLYEFFPHSPGGQTPQPIFTQNGSSDVDSREDVHFAVKISTFHTPWSPGPLKGKHFANFCT